MNAAVGVAATIAGIYVAGFFVVRPTHCDVESYGVAITSFYEQGFDRIAWRAYVPLLWLDNRISGRAVVVWGWANRPLFDSKFVFGKD